MTGCDHVEIQLPDFLQVPFDHIAKRHHDFGVIPLSRFDDIGVIPCIQPRHRDMRPQKITREQQSVFRQMRDHRLRPMHPRRVYEPKRFIPQRNRLPIFHRAYPVRGNLKVIHQQIFRLGRTNQLSVLIGVQHIRQHARMILLSMLRYHPVDLFDRRKLMLQYIGHVRIDRVYQHRLFRALHKISIVTGTVRQRDQRIKQPPVPIDRAHPINTLTYFSRSHNQSPFHGDRSSITLFD